MNYYKDTISVELAKKLQSKKMMIGVGNIQCGHPTSIEDVCFEEIVSTTYGDVFDWLMEHEIFITIPPIGKLEDGTYRFEAAVTYDDGTVEEYLEPNSWHESANAAIDRALTLF